MFGARVLGCLVCSVGFVWAGVCLVGPSVTVGRVRTGLAVVGCEHLGSSGLLLQENRVVPLAVDVSTLRALVVVTFR